MTVLWVPKDMVVGVRVWPSGKLYLVRGLIRLLPGNPALKLLVGFISGTGKLPHPKQTKVGASVERKVQDRKEEVTAQAPGQVLSRCTNVMNLVRSAQK